MEGARLKVCGMKDPVNILEIGRLKPDYLGFIFYKKSPRYVGQDFDPHVLQKLPTEIQKVGVFVNGSQEYIDNTMKKFGLDLIQLHGNESPQECQYYRDQGFKVIKAIPVKTRSDMKKIRRFQNNVDYLLFDAKGKNYGGNNRKFNWDLLRDYDLNIPFFLSGGIGPADFKNNRLKEIGSLQIHALDINSGFELHPGLKKVEDVRRAIRTIRKTNYE